MAKLTLTARIDALTSLVESLVAAQAPAAVAKPAPAKFAETEFGAKMLAKAAAKVACDIHATGCNRKFSPASAGRESHVARIV